MNSLVRYWAACELKRAPYLHPADELVARANPRFFDSEIRSHKQFLKSNRFGSFDDNRFHLSLLPVPYSGNLDRAKIIILLLNPGFGLSDYFVEENAEHARAVKRIIRQKLEGIEFPFLSLDPTYSWTGGFQWWEKKLRPVLRIIAKEKCRGNYYEALKYLSQRIAAIELIPYHSTSFSGHKLIKTLPSSIAALRFVQETLVQKARRRKVKIIATRQVAHWALPTDCDHVIAYSGGQTRGASLGPETPGGRAILERIRG